MAGPARNAYNGVSNKPDSNNNGIGIYLGSGDSTYLDGICAGALASSGAPGLVSSDRGASASVAIVTGAGAGAGAGKY